MKWQIMSKKETGFKDVLFVHLPLFNREIEIHQKKNGFLVNCYKETLADKKLCKTLSQAKKHARKWLSNEVKNIIKEVESIIEGSIK